LTVQPAADPEYRRNPITGWWVVVAPDRASKPESGEAELPLKTPIAQCPFCEGKERETPPETYAVRPHGEPNGPGWRVRCVPNQFPVVRQNVAADLDALASTQSRISAALSIDRSANETTPGWGVHEVIVESPRHVGTLVDEPPEHAETLAVAYRDRLRLLARQENVVAATLFHNSGRGGGASQEHVHSQLVGTPFVPPLLQLELDGAARFHAEHGVDPWGAMIEDERKAGVRVVAETDDYVVWCPWAGRAAYEMWLAPKKQAARFEDCTDAEARAFGALLRALVEKIERLLGPAFNYFLHSAPFGADPRSFRWHWEIMPRLAGIAGWEIGTDMFINTVDPETAAKKLREA
jgi:UDPglucose--hexose-1-phosphate uridylyltransferase